MCEVQCAASNRGSHCGTQAVSSHDTQTSHLADTHQRAETWLQPASDGVSLWNHKTGRGEIHLTPMAIAASDRHARYTSTPQQRYPLIGRPEDE